MLTIVLERALRSYLQWDPETLAKVVALSGKVIKVELTGWSLILYLCPGADGLAIRNSYEGEVHASIKGSPLSLLRVGMAAPHKKAQRMGSLEINGDVELAQTVSQIMQNCQVDWEEPLSRVTGDLLAHQISSIGRRFMGWSREAADQTCQNISEYLQEELHLLPPRHEIEEFFTDVYRLGDDVERVAARIQRMRVAQSLH